MTYRPPLPHSLFVAVCVTQSGAKHVYACECSDIALQAREIVALNGAPSCHTWKPEPLNRERRSGPRPP